MRPERRAGRGAEVRLHQRQPDRDPGEQHRQREALPGRSAGTEDGGEDEQQAELGQLRGLEAEGADPDPSGRAVRGDAHGGDGGEQQRRRCHRRPSSGRRASGRGRARRARGRACRHRRSWPAARRVPVASLRYRLASPSPTSANAATTASRSKAPLRRLRRCCRERRRGPRRGAAGGCVVRLISILDSAAHCAGAAGQEPTSTGGPAATAGRPVTANTARLLGWDRADRRGLLLPRPDHHRSTRNRHRRRR